jgi:hypothetical protein
VTWKPNHRESTPATKGVEPGKLGELTETIGSLTVLGKDIQSSADKKVIDQRAALVDVSSTSSRPLKVGEETLLINSSIMNLQYRPTNASWLVHLDLPTTV